MDFLSMTREQVEALPEAEAKTALDAWVKAKKSDLPLALIASSNKPIAKLAKKALYQLQSSGVAVQPVKEATAPAAPTEEKKNEFEGVLSMMLGTGERAIFFAHPVRGGGLEVFQGVIHDELGIQQLGSEVANRNLYRTRLNQLRKDPSARVMLVPFERIQQELGRALTLTQRAKLDIPTSVTESLERLKVTALDPEFPIPALESDDEKNAAEGASVHESFEVAQWLPGEPELVRLSGKADVINMLPGNADEKPAKIEDAARKIATEFFTEPIRQLYARRLWFTAELVESQQRTDEAKRLRAEARRLMHSTAPSAFAEQLFVKALPTLKKK